MPSSTSSVNTGYESDSLKPVKVKSRWRRSSELEMGGSGSLLDSRSGMGHVLPGGLISCPGSAPMNETKTGSGNSHDALTTGSVLNSENLGAVSFPAFMESIVMESSMTENNTNSSATTVIPKTIGAKISLPMVLEVKDREMEERLSQFEHLNENLYLTDR